MIAELSPIIKSDTVVGHFQERLLRLLYFLFIALGYTVKRFLNGGLVCALDHTGRQAVRSL